MDLMLTINQSNCGSDTFASVLTQRRSIQTGTRGDPLITPQIQISFT